MSYSSLTSKVPSRVEGASAAPASAAATARSEHVVAVRVGTRVGVHIHIVRVVAVLLLRVLSLILEQHHPTVRYCKTYSETFLITVFA